MKQSNKTKSVTLVDGRPGRVSADPHAPPVRDTRAERAYEVHLERRRALEIGAIAQAKQAHTERRAAPTQIKLIQSVGALKARATTASPEE